MFNFNEQIQHIEFKFKNIEALFSSISSRIRNNAIQSFVTQIQYIGIQIINPGTQLIILDLMYLILEFKFQI